MKIGPASSSHLVQPEVSNSGRNFVVQTWAEIRFLLKASRPGFWLTASWFYLLPLGAEVPLHSFAFWLGLFYVGFPLGMLIYAANDLTDVETDSLNPRKGSWLFGARPTHTQIRELPLRIFLIQTPFIVLFALIFGAKALVWFAAAFVGSAFYNRRGGAKDKPFVDTLTQAGYTLVFLLSAWLCGLPLAPWKVWVFGALFAMHSHLFGQIMDLEPDAAAGRTTTAVAIGVSWTKILMAVLLVIEAWLALSFTNKPWLSPILAMSAIWFLLDNWILWKAKPYATWQAKLFFLGWNLALLVETAFSAWFWSRGA